MEDLTKYNKKRDFGKTSEPKGTVKKHKGKLIFIIQKHQATQLHYDFRIEVDGVLKSWAVQKGPPNKSSERHLAMMVEDHPYDYKDFEGIIPAGQYGGGTVMLWDRGTYYIPEQPRGPGLPNGSKEEKDPDEIQKIISSKLKEGPIKLYLDGEKVKGKFALIKFKRAGDNAWLMIKDKDEYAGKEFSNPDKSVKTGRTLDEIGRNVGNKND